MINTDGVIYVLKKIIRSRDHWTRIATTQTEFERFGGTWIEQPIVEGGRPVPLQGGPCLSCWHGVLSDDSKTR